MSAMKRVWTLEGLITVCLIFPSPLRGQDRFEVGIHGGPGGYGYADDQPGVRGVIGAEMCSFCGGRRALFTEYSHWTRPRSSNTGYRSAESVEAGLRIQWHQHVRPFFDAGIVVGSSPI